MSDTTPDGELRPWLRQHEDTSVLHLVLPDPHLNLSEVFVEQRYGIPFEQTGFQGVPGGWELLVPLAPVTRLEYKIRVRVGADDDEDQTTDNDPLNPDQTPTAFGPISVLHREDYRIPGWLGISAEWDRQTLSIQRDGLGAEIPVQILCPAGLPSDEPAPLLIAHDGAEMDRLASLGTYAASVADRIGAFRVALVSPVHRDRWYGASTIYADALVQDVLPAIAAVVAVQGRPVGLGASLGALSFAHIQRRYPHAFSGLALQSGSFFTPTLDSQEGSYSGFDTVTRCVEHICDGTLVAAPIPVAFMCGIAEENLANNDRMRGVFQQQGYPVTWTEFPDGHNFIGWRDCWDPALTDLLEACFGTRTDRRTEGSFDA